MPVLAHIISLFRTLTHGARLDADLDDELRAHVDLLTDEKIAAGVPPEAARRAALVEVGGVEQVKEQVRDVRAGMWLDTVWQDVRYAVRTLRKTPGFTIVAVTSLALGIGLNATLFSAIQAVLLQPLPYADPDRVVEAYHVYTTGERGGVPPAAYLEWRRGSRTFQDMAVYDGFNKEAVHRDGLATEHIDILRVSSSFFQVLGRQPALGRAFGPGDDVTASNVAIVSDDWWRRRWQGDPRIIGRAITIDNVTYRVVGVMPPGFRFYHQRGYLNSSEITEVWLSDPFAHTPPGNEVLDTLGAIGRLKPGVTAAQASAELTSMTAAMRHENRVSEWVSGVAVVPLQAVIAEPSQRILFISWAIAAFVLFIAATNLAGLSLARVESRRGELDLRGALGASRHRLVRQLLTESLLLAGAAGVVGSMLVTWSGPLLAAMLPRSDTMVRLGEAGMTWQVLLFGAGVTALAALIFGSMPAVLGSKGDLSMRRTALRATTGRGAARVRQALIVVQLSLALVVVAAAVLLVATAWREQHVPWGFSPEQLLTMNVRYPRAAPYVVELGVRPMAIGSTGVQDQRPLAASAPHFALTPYGQALPGRIAERLAALPGVRAAAVGASMPLLRSFSDAFRVEGRPVPHEEAEGVWGLNAAVTPGYFETFGLRLIRGRGLTDADTIGTPKVAVVNQTMARAFLGGESRALGRRIITNPAAGKFVSYDVVGVVSDARFWIRNEVGPQMFTSYNQAIDPAYSDIDMIWRLDFWVAARTRDATTATVTAITRALEEVDGGAPVERVEFMDAIMARGSESTRGLLTLLLISAATALLLAAIGVFGVTAFAVSQRTRELGIRLALGASPRAILAHVLGGGLRLAVAGALLGALGAYWTNRVLASELYEVSPTDPRVFAVVVLLLTAVVLLATWLPARRAARVDPVIALRAE
jgi:putative ABC transport system permease protein